MHGWRRYHGGAELQRAVRLASQKATVWIWDQGHAKHGSSQQLRSSSQQKPGVDGQRCTCTFDRCAGMVPCANLAILRTRTSGVLVQQLAEETTFDEHQRQRHEPHPGWPLAKAAVAQGGGGAARCKTPLLPPLGLMALPSDPPAPCLAMPCHAIPTASWPRGHHPRPRRSSWDCS